MLHNPPTRARAVRVETDNAPAQGHNKPQRAMRME